MPKRTNKLNYNIGSDGNLCTFIKNSIQKKAFINFVKPMKKCKKIFNEIFEFKSTKKTQATKSFNFFFVNHIDAEIYGKKCPRYNKLAMKLKSLNKNQTVDIIGQKPLTYKVLTTGLEVATDIEREWRKIFCVNKKCKNVFRVPISD